MNKFSVICADPPWFFFDSLKMDATPRGAAANYPLMSNKDIQELPIKELISPEGSILALWVPSSLLQEGLNTMKAWGFTHKQTYIWVKTKKVPLQELAKKFSKDISEALKIGNLNSFQMSDIKKIFKSAYEKFSLSETLAFGMGRLFRQSHEICLIGVSNSKIYKQLKNKSQRSVSFAPNLRHSAKPEDLQDSLDLMFSGTNKLELFARKIRPGWICLGNEVCNGEDIRDSLAKL